MFTAEVLAVAIGYTAANLVAIWAGLSRCHWLIRFSVLAGVLTPLLALPNASQGIRWNLVTAAEWFLPMAAITVPLVGRDAIRQAVAERSVTFRLKDVLLMIAILCGLLGVASWAPERGLLSIWSTGSLVSLFCAAATLLATWAALSSRPKWLRLGVFVPAVLLGALPVALFSLGRWDGFIIDDNWQRYTTVCLQAFFVAGYLALF